MLLCFLRLLGIGSGDGRLGLGQPLRQARQGWICPIFRANSVDVGLRSGAYGLPLLRSVDLQVPVGEFVVLAGAPGPSRSAFLKLLAALYQPSFGRIRIDRSDIRQFDIRELRRCLALVSDEQVVEGSAAEKAGIRTGDVISSVNGQTLKTNAELRITRLRATVAAGAEDRFDEDIDDEDEA